jgi:RNA-binding protein
MQQAKSKKELRGQGTALKPTIHVGKDGLTEGVVDEVKNQIKVNKLVKVKVLASSSQEKKELAEELASRSGAKLIEVRGNTILLCDERVLAAKGGPC